MVLPTLGEWKTLKIQGYKMKIKKLTTSVLLPVTADVIANKNKEDTALFYNVKHGSRGEGLFTYTIGVDKRLFKPTNSNDKLSFDDNNYILLPIYDKKQHKKDSKNNYLYFISTDRMEEHKNDYIVLWEIPNRFYTDVSYDISGDVKLIGEGSLGRSRGSNIFTSPAPVLEVYGNCKLEWSGHDSKSTVYSQVITFKDGLWNIGKLIAEENHTEKLQLHSKYGEMSNHIENIVKPLHTVDDKIWRMFGDDTEGSSFS